APAAVGHADVKAAVGAERQAVDAALEAAAERETGPLVAAVNLLQIDAHDHRLGLVADETLAGERPEPAGSRVPDRFAGRLSHAAVRKPNARQRQGRHAADAILAFLAVVKHTAGIRLLECGGERRLLDPAQTGGVAVVFAFADFVHLASRHPLA